MDLETAKPVVMIFLALFVQYFVYLHDILETFTNRPIALIYPTCIGIICIWLDPDIIIAMNLIYMFSCQFITNLPCWEFLLLHPFIWSIIHANGFLRAPHILPLITMKFFAYSLQTLTPANIHFKVALSISSVIYLISDHLLKIKNDVFQPVISNTAVVLNICMNICMITLWTPIPSETVSIIDGICVLFIIGIQKIPSPIYLRYAFNIIGYLSPIFLPMSMPYTLAINGCISLALKEELYLGYSTTTFIRYFEHAIGFFVGYAILIHNTSHVLYIRCISIAGIFITQCAISYSNSLRVSDTRDCRCSISSIYPV